MFHRRFLLFLSVLLIGLTAKVVWSLVVTGSARPPCPDCITLPGKSPICPVPTSIIEREGATLDENVAGDVAGDFEPNIEPSLQPTPTATPDDDSAMVEPLIPPIQLTGSSTGDGVDDGPTFDHDWQAVFHPHGSQTCASGCATSRHPTAELDDSQFLQLMQQYVERPPYAASLALDSLLYFGRQTRRKLHGPSWRSKFPLIDSRQLAFLERELARDHVRLSIRVVDQRGERRAWIDDVSVPLDRRHVFAMETSDLQPLVTSGTVKRVGLDYLWTRL